MSYPQANLRSFRKQKGKERKRLNKSVKKVKERKEKSPLRKNNFQSSYHNNRKSSASMLLHSNFM